MLRTLIFALATTVALPAAAQNTCVFANDGECDEEQYGGGGFCEAGTDTNDCQAAITQASPQATTAPQAGAGDNSCVFANDGECDEEQYGGGGFCEAGTDTNDCRAQITDAGPQTETTAPVDAGNNSCEYANDNECDEARFGGQGYCADGTDATDCTQLRAGLNDDSCSFANDGECDEFRFGGTGSCQDGTDRADCTAWQTQQEVGFLERAEALNVDQRVVTLLGNNTCRWSYDDECDDPNFGGTGACEAGTDAMDCVGQKPVN